MNYKKLSYLFALFVFLLPMLPAAAQPAEPMANTYYVSSSTGDDDNNGLSESAPFETVSKVNSLELQPGDQVLFKCGDIWRADPLMITQSGAAGQPITFGSYPQGCADQPRLVGTQPISGWAAYNGSIYVADLNAGDNADKFALGVNQLFRDGERLLLGRWPNLDADDGGYSTIDSFSDKGQIGDNQLPAADWTGAIAHIKGMRWYILNREVTASDGQMLTLNSYPDCWGGSCVGWGYFLNNHLITLDRDGEWFYDQGTQKVYLYSVSGVPADGEIEGSVILEDDTRSWGAITLGTDLADPIAYVTVENFDIWGWFRHGIATPTNLHPTENHHITLQDNYISDVDGIGINLATWVYDADDDRPDGWRGGYNHAISDNIIERANRMGINTYTRNSTFSGNMIRDISLIENLGASGMGCDIDASGGHCTEDGAGIRIKVDKADDSGNSNTLIGNHLERVAHNGIDVFGYNNSFEHNVIIQPCYAKGDCGGVRTFGSGDLSSTSVHDLVFLENIIVDALGNTDGCKDAYDDLFAFGLYIDHYSNNVTVDGNTVISSTVHGILFQDSTGMVIDNTLYHNGRTYPYGAGQVYVGDSPAYVGVHTGNVLYSLNPDARTLSVSDVAQLGASYNNYFFSPYREDHISADGDKTLAEWQSYSGKDTNSVEHWFTRQPGEAPVSRIFYNDTADPKTFSLENIIYKDLDQNLVYGSLTLQPYQSQILIATGEGADLTVKMDLLGTSDTAPGAPLTYTLTITNLGVIAARPVTVTNPLPTEIVSTTWSTSPVDVTLVSGSHYTWEIDSLEAAEVVTITVTGQYTNTLTMDTPLMVFAEVSTASPEVNPLNNQNWILLGEWQQVYLPLTVR